MIMAESDGLVRWRVGDGEAPVVAFPAPEVAHASHAGEAGVSAPIDPVPMAYVASVIAERLAAALKMTPEEIDPHIPFADYGLDSILAVDLVDAINRALSHRPENHQRLRSQHRRAPGGLHSHALPRCHRCQLGNSRRPHQ